MSTAERVAGVDWDRVASEMDAYGCASTSLLLTPAECALVASLYDERDRFRSTIDMERFRFGAGQYRYFARPFPQLVAALREALYMRLLPIAREWAARLGTGAEWPDTLDEWLAECYSAGQVKPTPILLRYGPGDWNALHRDLYGEKVFPLQVVIGLDRPGEDYTGGEFMMVEQRPRAQSKGIATLLPQGQGLVFTTRERPVRSVRGWSAGPMRHGVSPVRSGRRHTLGLVFHDAA
jgi:hypothetical protein